MLYELKTYTLRPDRMQDCLKAYEEEGYAFFKPYEDKLHGYFTTEVGPLNRLIQVWKFDGHDDRDAMLNSLRGDPAFGAFAARLSPMFQDREAVLMKPAPFARCL